MPIKEDGFSLMEVLIGLIIFSIGFVSLTHFSESLVLSNERLKIDSEVLFLADKLAIESKQSILQTGWKDVVKNTNKTLQGKTLEYEAKVDLADWPRQGIKQISIELKNGKRKNRFIYYLQPSKSNEQLSLMLSQPIAP